MTIRTAFETIVFTDMTRMQRSLLTLLISCVSLGTTRTVCAQPQPTLTTRPAAKTAPKTAAGAAALPTEDTVNAFLFQMFGYEPTVTWKVTDIKPSEVPGLAEVTILLTNAQGSNANRLLVSEDGRHAITGEILPFGAKPFEDGRAKLESGVNGPSKGPARAAVTVVEFSDMQCPHCQKAEPVVAQLLVQEPDVRFVFQNFPLPAHNWAEKAAGYVDCVGRSTGDGKTSDAVWKFIKQTFDEQANITEANADDKLKAIATAAGANGDEVAACAVKPDTKARIEASLALGKSVGVTGTPAIFINGRAVGGGAPVEVLKKMVEFSASQEKADK